MWETILQLMIGMKVEKHRRSIVACKHSAIMSMHVVTYTEMKIKAEKC